METTCTKPEGRCKENPEESISNDSDSLTLCYDEKRMDQSYRGTNGPDRWPENCKFYVPETMDGAYLRQLMDEETQYLTKKEPAARITCLEFPNSGQAKTLQHSAVQICRSSGIAARGRRAGKMKIIFVKQKRLYHCGGSKDNTNKIFVARDTWNDVLEKYSIHSQVVELIHDNQGGNARYLSYANGTEDNQDPEDKNSNLNTASEVSAFDICVKIGDFVGCEHFVYGRYDFQSHETVILVVGSDAEKQSENLRRRIMESNKFDLFCVLLDLSSFWYHDMEARRFDLDSGTQYLEAHAGLSSFHHPGVKAVPFDQLKLHPSMVNLAQAISVLARGSRVIKGAFTFLNQQLLEFDSICRNQACCTMEPILVRHISEAFQQKISLAGVQLPQVEELKGRANAQLKLVSLLIAQRDSRTNLDIASAARRDSRTNIEIASSIKMDSNLMKGIAAVTMVFLPGTFMATFFSMTFFNMDSRSTKHLSVSPWLWLYGLLTVPMTLGILIWYWLMERTSNSVSKAVVQQYVDECDARIVSRRSSAMMIQL